MPFVESGLQVIAQGGAIGVGANSAKTVWHYVHGSDTPEQIAASGYFNAVADQMKQGDTILVQSGLAGATRASLLGVTSASLAAVVTTAPMRPGLFAAAALDFPAIAAQGTAQLNIAVPGAAIGDAVKLALPATVNNGVVFDARVTAADTVSVRAQNITAAAIDPASATYGVIVSK
jgi:hypothetical protein